MPLGVTGSGQCAGAQGTSVAGRQAAGLLSAPVESHPTEHGQADGLAP